MTRRVLVLDGSCDPAAVAGELATDFSTVTDIVALCWLAPDTLDRLAKEGRVRCHPLPEVVGGVEAWERAALARAEAVCGAGPRHLDVPWRTVLAEPLFREALWVEAVRAAERLCSSLDAAEVTFRVAPEVAAAFHRFTALRPPRPAAVRPPTLAARLVRRGRRILLTGDLRGQLWNLLDQLDRRYRLRLTLNRLAPNIRLALNRLAPNIRLAPDRRIRPGPAAGVVACLSSYLNNSRTLRSFEPYLAAGGEPVHWVVTNHYARAGAAGHRGTLDWLWRFAPQDAPGAAEDAALPAPPADWLAASPTWGYWRDAGEVATRRLTACWERYLAERRPRLVAVASLWGLDGWLAQVAARRGVPVLQLLHGVIDGVFYTQRPVHADALVVWGEVWRELWPETERPRIHVFNPPAAFPPVARRPRAETRPPRLTYFSWPFDRLPFYDGAELCDGFIDLFHDLLTTGACELTVRAHPLENLADFVARWRRRRGALPPGVRLGQHEPLAEVLAATDVAVMFRSTVMLDCLASGVPMVIPGWIDFSWAGALAKVGTVALARDFADLGYRLRSWLADPPASAPAAAGALLRPAGEGREELLAILAQLKGKGRS